MRILIVSQYFWPESFRINDLAQGLRDLGHAVTVLTGVPNYPGGRAFDGYRWWAPRREDYEGISVRRVPLMPRGSASGWRLALNYLSFALSASVLGPARCTGRFDVIFVYEPSPITVGIPAIVLKWIKRAPLLFWVQDLWPESLSATGAVSSPWILGLVKRLVKFIYHRCDRILVQSRAFAPAVQRLASDASRVRYFPNSAEALYRPVDSSLAESERRCLPEGFRVMFAGNIGAAQDFATILAAAEKLRDQPDIKWVILGDGRMRAWVEEQVRLRGLGGSVFLIGKHPVDAMPRFFSLADALLVTLRRDPIFAMTIPAKVQSYLACGRPIVGALDGEGAVVVREAGAGIIGPAEDPAALADAVLDLYRMPREQREALGTNGLRYFRQTFERDRLLQQLDGWMKELAGAEAACAS